MSSSLTPARASSFKDERERRRKIRESVRNYYEVDDAASNNNNNQQSSNTGSPKTGTTSSTTQNQNQNNTQHNNSSYQQQQRQRMDLDSTSFNATAYTTSLMRQSSLPKLLETDTVLRHSVKALDKELQDLVYSNYSKFITAAETIKEVRSSVIDMENKLQDLDDNVEKMEAVSSRVTRELERHRHLVDQEVATNSMLRKVQFLVMLPQIMETAARAEKWLEAAQYWSAGDAIFTKYSEFPSFVRTQNDCRLKAEQLYSMLSRKICSGATVAATPTPSSASSVDNNNNNNGGGGPSSSSPAGPNSGNSGNDENEAATRALSSKLSALQLLANTSVDISRLQKMGVVLVPTIAAQPEGSDALSSTSRAKATVSVLEKARDVLYRSLINEFQEQTNDTVAHVRIDFLHRKEDLERHAKKIQANLKSSEQQQQANLTSPTTNALVSSSSDPVVALAAEELKSSLVDLSLALRKRYIAKLEQIIRDNFKKLASRMSVIQNIVANAAAAAGGASSSSSSDEATSTSSSTSSMKSTTSILESALSKILDEICTCTKNWMQDSLNTFTGCVVDAALAFNKAKSIAPATSLFLLSAPDVDSLVTTMCETFFDAILDTEKTFTSLAKRFLLINVVATSSSAAEQKNNNNNNTKTDQEVNNNNKNKDDDENNNNHAATVGGDISNPSSFASVPPSPAIAIDATLTSTTTVPVVPIAAPLSLATTSQPATAPVVIIAADSVLKPFIARVSRKTQQLLFDLEKILKSKQDTINAQIADALDEDKHFADEVEFYEERKKFQKREELLTKALVPVICYSAVARACSNLLKKSSLAHEISWMNTTPKDASDDDNNNNTTNNSTTANSSNNNNNDDQCLLEHKRTLESTAVTLASSFVRFTNLTLLSTEIRRGFFSSKFGFEATEPTEPSDMISRITRSMRHRTFLLQLLLGGAGTLSTKSSSSSSSRNATTAQLHPNFPLVAQFTRRDAVGGARADMERIFAPKSNNINDGTAGGNNINNNNSALPTSSSTGDEKADALLQRSKLILRNNPAAWYSLSWPMDAATLSETIVICILTSILETVRESSVFFSRAGSQQLQVDASFLLHVISELKMSVNCIIPKSSTTSSSSSSNSTLTFPPVISARVDEILINLVTEFACSVFDRTKERSPLSNSAVEQIAYTNWKKK